LDHLDLRYLEIAETLAWPAQRRLGLPVDQVIGPRVPDHPALVGGCVAGAGGQEHMPAVTVGVSQYPRIAPRLVEP
jgi:hypothetical protein